MAGSIRKRGENTWELTVTRGRQSDGKKRRFYKTAHCSERQAKKELALFVAEVEQKHFLSLENITLAGFAERWLRDYAEPQLTQYTVHHYKQLLTRILEAMGHLKLTQITPLHITEFYSNLREDGIRKDGKSGGLSKCAIKHHHTALKKILNDAVRWEVIATNPVSKIQAPKLEKKEPAFYNEEQTAQLLLALEQEEMQFRVLVQVVLVTGCRKGEVIALQWPDVHFDTEELTIERAITYTPGSKQEVKTTKTEESRTIALPEEMIKTLSEYKKYQNETHSRLGWGKTKWLFTGKTGDVIHLSTPGSQFGRFVKKHNLPYITLHGLRHTHGTTLLAATIDVRTVANRLGHSETSTTLNVYAHALKSADKKAADIMNRILTGDKNRPKK